MNSHLAYLLASLGLFTLALGLIGFLAIRYHEAIRVRWHELCRHPWVSALRKRCAPQLVFLKNRLTPRSYLGLHLTIGSLVIILSCWWFGGIAEDLIEKDSLIQIDQQLSHWLHMSATPGLTSVARWLTLHARRWRWRVLAPLLAALIILLVALTRIYLGAHFLSDVLAAMAAATAWVAVCTTAVETIRRTPWNHRQRRAV